MSTLMFAAGCAAKCPPHAVLAVGAALECDDGTVFTVVVTSLNESGKEREIVNDFYDFGRTYAAYAGKTVDNIHIDYRNQHGDLLWTRDSNQSP